ncbi:uncharacterized protein [Diabrotica undecimpunctata]|uniref:uncharacterized protein n=1 Tax=Diabrotica undecimpunctata TaxID=50387 RepID=UPI003B63FD25
MGPSVVGRTKIDLCPVCGKPYREERMVECTECKKWCCFECVNVQDDSEVIGDDSWKCPLCIDAATKKSHPQGSKIKKSCSATSLKSSSSTSSKTKMKLQLLQEERDLLRQERELTKESRRIIEEDECSNASQDIDEEEIIETNPLVNKFLSLNIDKPVIDNIAPLTPTLGKPLPTYNDKSSGILYKRRDPGDLPIFNGNPYDWPVFISSFERSTELCQVDNHENILRLQKCLKGPARVSVSSFLILPQCVPQIIATLKILFGRPEQIIEAYINSIRRLPPPKPEKLETLVEFALAVKNLCVLLEASNLKDYLNNPTLMHELLEKLPSQIKVNWAIYRSAFQNFQGLRELADWLYNLATNVCSALPTLALNDQSNKKRQFNNNVHANIHEPNASSETHNCKLCNQRDCKKIAGCSEFQRYSLSQRWEAVKALNLCRLCLKKHRFPCKYPVKCNKEECQRKHHPLLHEFSEQVSNKSTKLIKKESGMQTVESHLLSADEESNAHQGTRFRILPVVLRNGSREVTTFAFLDEGSSVTLLEESIAKKLNIMGNPEQLCLKWTGNQQRLEDAPEKVFFSIAGDYNGAKEFDHRPARTVRKLGLPKQTLDAKAIKESFPYLKNLPFKSYKNAVPQILIGLDNWDLALPLRMKEGLELQPIAAKSRLGWTIFAMFSNNDVELNYSYHICECSSESITNQELFNTVKDFFSVESLGVQNIKPSVSKELDRAINIQQSTLVQIGNQYKIGLLWKYDNLKLPNSKPMAIQRLECIERKIKKNPELGTKMNQQIQDFLEKKYIRKLSEQELLEHQEKTWYLPIFPAFNPNKPDKFRLVWDAAATVQGISLNSMLLKGDDQLASLLGVLLRFRERKIGFSGDIKEMFLRVGIIEEDQHAQRFLWRNGSSDNPLEVYIMTVMTFGATCSPSCAQFDKNANAKKFSVEYPSAVDSIVKNHYVDDVLESTDTEDEAIQLAKEIALIHASGNFEIRNWRSNSEKLIKIMNTTHGNNEEVNLDMGNNKSMEKVLGMWWDLKGDNFIFNLKCNKGNKDVLSVLRKPTKREILQILMSVYDPVGLLANFLIYVKILLQEIWRSNISWDQPITNEQCQKWLVWLKQLPEIEKVSIPRYFLNKLENWKDTNTQMHIFVDASEHASACVAYLRIMKKDVIECTLIGAKTHVAPLKPQTIPRLELNGAVMGSRFAKSLCQYLSITVHNIVYWTDSSTVLSWLRNEEPRKLPKYVAYRVAEIQQNSMISHWRYVPTKNNIADEATKWTKRPNLKNTRCWFKGPDFLYQLENSWPPDTTLKKEKADEILTTHEVKFNSPRLIDFERFSQFNRILRATAYMFRFLRIVYAKKSEEPKGILISEELLGARNILIKQTQCEYFKNEIKQLKTNNSGSLQKTVNKSNSLYKLSPYLDEDGLLRIRGRLDEARDVISETKRPIILPRGSRLTLLIIEDYHKRYHHRNHEIVVNEIRQKFYIPKLRQLVKKIRTNCQNCKVKFAKPKPPEMSPLPPCRLVTFTAPFTHTGMDYFGPINVTVGRRTEKRWGALFTCLTTRAVHLEVAYKLDVVSFILCLTNFIYRRGRPRHIYCDRGTNFMGAPRESG